MMRERAAIESERSFHQFIWEVIVSGVGKYKGELSRELFFDFPCLFNQMMKLEVIERVVDHW